MTTTAIPQVDQRSPGGQHGNVSEGVSATSRTFSWLAEIRDSRSAKLSASNAGFSLVEYLAQPVLMVVSAPYLVSHLGTEQFGIWMLVTVLSGTVGILNLGLNDATIKYVSVYRGRKDLERAQATVRGTLTLSILIGGVSAGALIVMAPFLARHVFHIDSRMALVAVRSMRLAGLVLWIQCIYWVFSGALKAFEEFGPPAKIGFLSRLMVMTSAVVLVAAGRGVVAILVATVFVTLLATFMLSRAARRTLSASSLWPAVDKRAWSEVFNFGIYSWIQGAASLAFSQADRLMVAAFLGAGSLTYYSLCVQVAQQIHGIPAAAFNFLLPLVSAKQADGRANSLKRIYKHAIFSNVVASVALVLPLLFFSKPLLRFWMGSDFAEHSYVLLRVLVIAFFLLSLNVAPHFTLLGLGRFRFVSFINLLGGALSVGATALLTPFFGLAGAATARLLYGAVTTWNYVKVRTLIR